MYNSNKEESLDRNELTNGCGNLILKAGIGSGIVTFCFGFTIERDQKQGRHH